MKARSRFLIGTMLAGTVAALAPAGFASSHREAPAISGMPRVDATDFYMFRSYEPGRGDFTTIIANYIPVQAPYGGPNYFTLDNNALYEIHIDNDGDAVEDLTFQFDFSTALANGGAGIALNVGGQNVAIPLRQAGQIAAQRDPNLNEIETYKLTLVRGDRRTGNSHPVGRPGAPTALTFTKPVDNIGTKTLPEYESYARKHIASIKMQGCPTAGKVFVGQRAEAFAVNLGKIFDLVNLVPIEGDSAPGAGDGGGFPGGVTQDPANNQLSDANVTSIALEIPTDCLVGNGNGVIGGWTTASLPTNTMLNLLPGYNGASTGSGGWTQVSRLSNPLVNEVVIGLPDKDLFNTAEPTQDGALAGYVTNPSLPALLNLLFRAAVNTTLGTNIADLAPTNFPRNDLVTAFLTGFPGLNQQATVTGSEMIRLNTAVPPTLRAAQSPFGVVGEDLAGFPNGRRPGDDTVDIALRVVMGALCHPVPLGAELGVPGAVEDTASDLINLGLCAPGDASVGNVPFTDGAPLSARDVSNRFPYLNSPTPGAS